MSARSAAAASNVASNWGLDYWAKSIHEQLGRELLGLPAPMNERYRLDTLCCVYCGRVFIGEINLDLHLKKLSLPLWQRALYTRYREQKLRLQRSRQELRKKFGNVR